MRNSLSLAYLTSIVSRDMQPINLPAIIITAASLPDLSSLAATPFSGSLTLEARIFKAQVFRRWRGGLPGDREETLLPPKQGVTKYSRLMLARDGVATGSFRLNCAETPFAVDEKGMCLYQVMDAEEELATQLGSMERSISSSSPNSSEHASPAPSRSTNHRHSRKVGLPRNISLRAMLNAKRRRTKNTSRYDKSRLSGSLSASVSCADLWALVEDSENDSELTKTPPMSPSASLRSLLAACRFHPTRTKHPVKLANVTEAFIKEHRGTLSSAAGIY